MSTHAQKLTQKRRQEQEIRGYATSSRWYTGLSNTISFLERAETGDDPLDRFRDTWAAAYNLFMMYGQVGEDEFKRFNSWATEVKEIPEVRRLLSDGSDSSPFVSFRQHIDRAKRALLKTQGLQDLTAWQGRSVSPDKACRYFLTIIRDIRNACGHPEFNPNNAATKKALASAADCLIPVVVAATEAMVERPVDGTTGRTTAYRSFLWPFLKNSDSFFSDYYLERLFSEEELGTFPEEEAKERLKGIAKEFAARHSALMTADAEDTQNSWCEAVLFPVLGTNGYEGVRLVSGSDVFQPSYVLQRADLSGKPRREYQGKDAGRDLACVVWVLPWRTTLDAVSTDLVHGSLPVMEIAHRALTASDVPWAVLTNGRQLRLLRKGAAHKPRCFLEVDLAAVIDQRGYAEALLAFRYFLGLFSGASFTDKDDHDHTRLDRVLIGSERHGKEIGDELKQNVFGALEELGEGFLDYLRAHRQELDKWRKQHALTLSSDDFLASGQLLTDIYHESLSLMYRLLFLFYAESRNLLPMEEDIYRDTYSLESIRDDIISTHDDPDPKRFFSKGSTDLWDRLQELFRIVNSGWRNIVPVYNGGLFDPDVHEFLERFKVGDSYLARAIDLLSRTQPRTGQSRGEGRKKVTYRDLDIRHLGSIYEGILEYSAHVADQDKVVMKRGSGNKAYEEYVAVADLTREEKQQLKDWRQAKEENPDNPKLPSGCRVVDVKEKGNYFLVYGGRESKRKSSGSYYTPDYIVQYIVENTLEPLMRGENREDDQKNVPLTADEILELKVLDPAMGSGHFLVAATEYLARVYGEALIKEGKDTDGVMSEDDFIRYKRMVAERCIYGVDINPMAVELAKLSLWLFTMDRGRPLSFLNHHLKCGNSLIGAWIKDLGELPEFDRNGKPKKKQTPEGQGNLFEHHFKARVPLMIRDIFGIMKKETLTYEDIQTKKALDQALEDLKRPFKNVADAWVGTFFGEKARDYDSMLSNIDRARERKSVAAGANQFFHWELGFPEVFFDEVGRHPDKSGFDAVVGNPPWLMAGYYVKTALDFLREEFNSAVGKFDLYYVFIEQGSHLLSDDGLFGMIVPNKFFHTTAASDLRTFLSSKSGIRKIVDFGDEQIFVGATNYSCILFLQKRLEKSPKFIRAKADLATTESFDISWSAFSSNTWYFEEENARTLFEKIEKLGEPLEQLVSRFGTGAQSGADRLLMVDRVTMEAEHLEPALLRPILRGQNVRRYTISTDPKLLIFPYKIQKSEFIILSETELAKDKKIYNYLLSNKNKLADRIWFGKGPEELSGEWYGMMYLDSYSSFATPHILTPSLSDRSNFALGTGDLFVTGTAGITSIIPKKDAEEDILYLLGVLNSALISFYVVSHSPVFSGGYYKFSAPYLRQLPIRRIDFSDSLDRACHNRMVGLVDQMLELYKQLAKTNSNQQKASLQNQIDSIDRQIDRLVYELYGLTEAEIAIVEGRG